MFFDSWTTVGHTLATGVAAYIILIVFLRLSGKRTLGKMNAFDFVITIAIGSTLSAVLVSRQVPLADGVAALALLVVLQYLVAWACVRSPGFEGMVKSSPTLLLYQGRLLGEALLSMRVSEADVLAAVRNAGLANSSQVGAVVLETDGSLSVIGAEALRPGQALEGVSTPGA